MKTTLSGMKALEGIVAAAIVATTPLMVQATETDAKTASALPKTAESMEIASLKRQIYLCHHHKRHARACPLPVAKVIEKTVVVEKPVTVEKIVEKQVFVERPALVEKQTAVETQVEMDRRVIVEHSAHRRHLLHLGIPLISVNLF
jgi:hypothetical protein